MRLRKGDAAFLTAPMLSIPSLESHHNVDLKRQDDPGRRDARCHIGALVRASSTFLRFAPGLPKTRWLLSLFCKHVRRDIP